MTRISALELEGAPPDFPIERKRDIIGEPLTPDRLDLIEIWSRQRLRALGYACATVHSTASPRTGEVRLQIKSGDVLPITTLIEESAGGLKPGMLQRYFAFSLSDPYNGDKLRLTEQRIITNGILQNVQFVVKKCDEKGVTVEEHALAGAPRLLTFGFGINTEGLLLARSYWRNTRLGPTGSSLTFLALASSKEQRLIISSDWYHLPFPTRRFLSPYFEFRHQNENPFEALTTTGRMSEATTYDGSEVSIRTRAGPQFDWIRTLRGSGPPQTSLGSLSTAFELGSHYYEALLASPRAGFRLAFTGDFSAEGLLSNFSAQRLSIDFRSLWNYKNYDPPLWIFGLRTQLSTTLTPEQVAESNELPATFRHFLGGSQNVRGFGRTNFPWEQPTRSAHSPPFTSVARFG